MVVTKVFVLVEKTDATMAEMKVVKKAEMKVASMDETMA